jgi:UDPglucose 6-dehydrogenase
LQKPVTLLSCIDIDETKIKKLSAGEITIYEPGLEKLFLRNQREGRLTFTTNLAEGVDDALLILLALPTPPDGMVLPTFQQF